MAARHSTTTALQPAWKEWRAECVCGWVGSYLPTRSASEREALAHKAEAAKG
jgi:hypothetical protein